MSVVRHAINCKTPATMTLELKWLIYTALLAGSLWIPFIVGVNITDFPGKAQLFILPVCRRFEGETTSLRDKSQDSLTRG